MLVSGIEALRIAAEGNYALPAINYINMEHLQAIIAAAEELQAPVIIQTSQNAIDYAGFEYLRDIGVGAAQRAKVPVVLHLDHGKDLALNMRCIRYGWTSVMMDASLLPFEENVAAVREVTRAAHCLDISVEAELGFIGGKEGDADAGDVYTKAEDACRFFDESGCDSLAIAVGTQHGLYKGEVKIDYQRIREIKEAVGGRPLVLHGTSFVPLEMVAQAIDCGINKVNFDSELKMAGMKAIRGYLAENPDAYDLRKMNRPMMAAMKEVAMEKIRICKAEGKSWLK